jgi:TRAP-type C4-dicarboxylate transport system substrate-binding protein
MVVVNQKDFEKLDKPTQDTLVRLAGDAEKRGWERMRSYTTESLDILRRNRMTVVTPSPQLMSDMRKIGDEMLAEWLKQAGPEGKEIIDAYRKSTPAPKK